MRSSRARTVSEVPDDFMVFGIHFDDPVVELVGNQDVAPYIEMVSLS
jgi:hypothetical protein